MISSRRTVLSTVIKDHSLKCVYSTNANSPNAEYTVSPIYHNRNPRNLEKLGLARKRVGWKFQAPRKDYYHKLVFEPTLRHTEAHIEHSSGETVVSVSTKEWAIRNHLYSCSDISASENIGRILSQRCLETGLTAVFFDSDEAADQNSAKVSAFLRAFKDSNISLKEPNQIQPSSTTGIDYDGYHRYDEPKHWKDDYQER